MYLGRCKLSRPGSQWGEKGFHPFPKQISCSQVTREKKISEQSEPSGSLRDPVFAPIPPPPSLRSLVPGQCKLQTCGGVLVFLGSFQSWEGGGGG